MILGYWPCEPLISARAWVDLLNDTLMNRQPNIYVPTEEVDATLIAISEYAIEVWTNNSIYSKGVMNMSENGNTSVPLYVIKALAEVRENGSVNMMDRRGVTALVNGQRASEWLDKASDSQYMDALNEMGEYISVPDFTNVLDDDDTQAD